MVRRLPEDFVVGTVAAQSISRKDLEDLRVMNADPEVMATLGGVRDRYRARVADGRSV